MFKQFRVKKNVLERGTAEKKAKILTYKMN